MTDYEALRILAEQAAAATEAMVRRQAEAMVRAMAVALLAAFLLGVAGGFILRGALA